MKTENQNNFDKEFPEGYNEFWNIENNEDSNSSPNLEDPSIAERKSVNFVDFVKAQSELGRDHWSLLESTPTIPAEIIDMLPSILKETTIYFNKSERERDIFLTGAIGILSACFPKISGIYHGSRVFSNLNTLISAPAANGKGVLRDSLRLVDSIHTYKRNEYEKLKKEAQSNTSKAEASDPMANNIPDLMFVIPGNSSFSAIMKILGDNDGIGVICETEADTLNNVMKQDWGDYSTMIRMATHHEPITQSRVSTGSIEIKEPKLSVVLSGTPGQLKQFISSTENGLFSRFLYYVFVADSVFSDPSPKAYTVPKDDFFSKYACLVIIAHTQCYKDRNFELTERQWSNLNQKYTQLTSELSFLVGSDITSGIFRIALFQFRLAMLFSILRACERNQYDENIICEDIDFEISDRLIDVYLKHAMTVYRLLPRNDTFGIPNGCKTFLDNIPDGVLTPRKDLVAIGAELSISEGSIDKYLSKLVALNFLDSPMSGKYIKIKRQ